MGPESYIQKFERVVDLLRPTGNYTIVGNEVTSDVLTYLTEGDYITLDGLKVRVTLLVSDKVFQVEVFGQTITASGIWKSLAPYFDYGTRRTINIKLMEKNGGEYAYQKYPLIALRLPTLVQVEGGIATIEANLLIANFTNKHYRPEDRIANVFEEILWPLTKLLVMRIGSSGEFIGFEPSYSQIDRLFYGTETGEENIANIFDDPLDAVEIRIKLKYFIDGCVAPSATTLDAGFEYVFSHPLEN